MELLQFKLSELGENLFSDKGCGRLVCAWRSLWEEVVEVGEAGDSDVVVLGMFKL